MAQQQVTTAIEGIQESGAPTDNRALKLRHLATYVHALFLIIPHLQVPRATVLVGVFFVQTKHKRICFCLEREERARALSNGSLSLKGLQSICSGDDLVLKVTFLRGRNPILNI
ncbi:hypothetical protein Pelo_4440 [Pelomyxa schiedti]|nr:hypothetical protein Pelo_4440 [Pelomyxa schiedti]